MQKTSKQEFFPKMPRLKQISSFHCGPAVLAMLLAAHDVQVLQREVVDVLGIGKRIYGYGMLVSDMEKAVKILAPNLRFWQKQEGTVGDLVFLTKEQRTPVGVEWQGIFYEDEDDDNGHYSVVTHVDTNNDIIYLSDPYRRFAGVDRQLHISGFEERWWDQNEVLDKKTGSKKILLDHRMMFVVTPKEATFPQKLGMK